jgi:glutathione S-transferase
MRSCATLQRPFPPGGLLPAEARARAIADQWLSWQATELNPSWGYAFLALARKAPGYEDPRRIAESTERWGAKMTILEARLQATGAFAAGDAFSLADISLGLSVHRWLRTLRDGPDLPAVGAYYERLLARPAGARWMVADVP